MDARGNAGASTCVTPSCPQPNPPSGIIPRTHSITVHSPASPNVPSSACSRRQTAGARAPNAAVNPADMITSAAQPSSPNRRIQYRSAPK